MLEVCTKDRKVQFTPGKCMQVGWHARLPKQVFTACLGPPHLVDGQSTAPPRLCQNPPAAWQAFQGNAHQAKASQSMKIRLLKRDNHPDIPALQVQGLEKARMFSAKNEC